MLVCVVDTLFLHASMDNAPKSFHYTLGAFSNKKKTVKPDFFVFVFIFKQRHPLDCSPNQRVEGRWIGRLQVPGGSFSFCLVAFFVRLRLLTDTSQRQTQWAIAVRFLHYIRFYISEPILLIDQGQLVLIIMYVQYSPIHASDFRINGLG